MEPLKLIIERCSKPEVRMSVYLDAISYLENGVDASHTKWDWRNTDKPRSYSICSALFKAIAEHTHKNGEMIITTDILFSVLPEFKEMYYDTEISNNEYFFPLEPLYVVRRIKFLKDCISLLNGVEV